MKISEILGKTLPQTKVTVDGKTVETWERYQSKPKKVAVDEKAPAYDRSAPVIIYKR